MTSQFIHFAGSAIFIGPLGIPAYAFESACCSYPGPSDGTEQDAISSSANADLIQ